MKLRYLIVPFSAFTSVSSFGAIGVVESTGLFTVNSNDVYLSPIPGSTSNTNLNNYDFGDFNPATGDTLVLKNWFLENYAYNSGGTGTFDNNWINSGNSATLILTINGIFNNQSLSYDSSSGNNHFWNNSPDTVNLLTGLSNGDYTLSVSIEYTFNQYDGSQTNVHTSSNNGPATASFTVVPEPASAALGLLGATLLLRRRRV
jgi:MYXO-CTERM domain-containing protein